MSYELQVGHAAQESSLAKHSALTPRPIGPITPLTPLSPPKNNS